MSNYAFEGPKWSSSTITWSFAAAGGDFTNAISGAYQATVRAAVARWSQVTNLTFKEVADNGGVNIRIGWGTFPGTQVGETRYSYQQSSNAQNFVTGTTVRLEDPSARSLGTGIGDYYQGTSTTLYQVVLHEFGHAIGLAHSTDPSAVMYASVGPNDNALGTSDIQGIQQLYGAPAAATVLSNMASAPIMPATITMASGTVAVYRFFDTNTGTQLLTANAAERDNVIRTRPDLTYEGLGLAGIAPGADATAIPVYRFFNTSNGTHFFTSSQSEQATILATRSDLVLEQTTFFEHATQQAGDIPVYRFFSKTDGSHFFTSSASERATIVSTRSDMAYEGIAFYAPSTAGAAANAAPDTANAAAQATGPVLTMTDDTDVVYGFTSIDGRQFLTTSAAEANAVSDTVPTMTYQGVAMGSVCPDAGDEDAAPVFRFFNVNTGDHFLTADVNEAAQLAASRPDMIDEGVAFYEHLTQQQGDVAVFRFFDNATGTHFYTPTPAEQSAAGAVQPGMTFEGVAFYAPSISA